MSIATAGYPSMSSYALDLLLHESVLLHGARVVVTLAVAHLGSLHTIGLQAVQDILQSATQRGPETGPGSEQQRMTSNACFEPQCLCVCDLLIFRFSLDWMIMLSFSLCMSTWMLNSCFSWLSWAVAFCCCFQSCVVCAQTGWDHSTITIRAFSRSFYPK